MKTLNRKLQIALASVAFATGNVAFAEDCPDEPDDCPTTTAQAEPMPEPMPPEPAPAPAPQPQPSVAYEPQVDVVAVEVEPEPTLGGFALTLGGGVDDFSGSDMRSGTGTGGSWNLRGTFGTKSWVAVEGAYIGSAQSIDMGFGADATLVGNGAEALLRLNAGRNLPAQPFAFGGVGWRHYSLVNDDNDVIGLNDNIDDVIEFPVGIGVAAYIGNFTLDVRGQYRFAVDEELFEDPDVPGEFATMDRWGVTANLGYEL